MRLIISIIVVVVVGLGTTWLFERGANQKDLAVSDFLSCVRAGNPVMESYPRQCAHAGQTYVEEIEPISRDPDPVEKVPEQPVTCQRAGCSGQLCVSAAEAGDIVTTCEFRPEYACYSDAVCEVQPGGACGWSQTGELEQCLQSAGSEV